MFQITEDEKQEVVANCDHLNKLKFSPVLPYAFTEHGALMAANVLNSTRAVEMSVYVIRAFIRMRALISENQKFSGQLKILEEKLTCRLDSHEIAIIEVLRRLMKLIDPPPVFVPPKPKIGF